MQTHDSNLRPSVRDEMTDNHGTVSMDTIISVPSTATPSPTATPTHNLHHIERLPDGRTRVYDHGRVTFCGIIGGRKP